MLSDSISCSNAGPCCSRSAMAPKSSLSHACTCASSKERRSLSRGKRHCFKPERMSTMEMESAHDHTWSLQGQPSAPEPLELRPGAHREGLEEGVHEAVALGQCQLALRPVLLLRAPAHSRTLAAVVRGRRPAHRRAARDDVRDAQLRRHQEDGRQVLRHRRRHAQAGLSAAAAADHVRGVVAVLLQGEDGGQRAHGAPEVLQKAHDASRPRGLAALDQRGAHQEQRGGELVLRGEQLGVRQPEGLEQAQGQGGRLFAQQAAEEQAHDHLVDLHLDACRFARA
eukprot:scaffold5075_cov296-Prasinococcus_capsulatus_cf.AAC.7